MFLSALASDAGCKLVVGDPDCSLDALPRPRNRSHRLGATIDAMKPRRQANSIRLEAADWSGTGGHVNAGATASGFYPAGFSPGLSFYSFDGFHATTSSVSKTHLVRFDNNKYSVVASSIGRPVEVQAYADRIIIRQRGRIVAEHPRSFARGETIYDPWHYVRVLARKPGALRNGAPFEDWVLPAAMMLTIWGLTDGLPAVKAACAQAISHGVHSADVVLNILARQRLPSSLLASLRATDSKADFNQPLTWPRLGCGTSPGLFGQPRGI
jgi:hypothetical protein